MDYYFAFGNLRHFCEHFALNVDICVISLCTFILDLLNSMAIHKCKYLVSLKWQFVLRMS